MSKSLACLNLKCAMAKEHVKGCVGYGYPYPEFCLWCKGTGKRQNHKCDKCEGGIYK